MLSFRTLWLISSRWPIMPIVSVSMSLSFALRLINRGPIVFPAVRGGDVIIASTVTIRFGNIAGAFGITSRVALM